MTLCCIYFLYNGGVGVHGAVLYCLAQVPAADFKAHPTNSTTGPVLFAAATRAGSGALGHQTREHHAGGSGQVLS